MGACTSVEQEALDELSSTEAASERKMDSQLQSVTFSNSRETFTRRVCSGIT